MLNRIKKRIKKVFSKKYPVYIPVMYGKLLVGRKALITGGGQGIGFAISAAFARNGCSVIITGRNEEKLINAVQKIKETKDLDSNVVVEYIVLDNTKTDSFTSRLNEIIQKIGSIDILVNNAGVISKTHFGNTDYSDYHAVISTDLDGVYWLSETIANYFISNEIKGNILNVSSSSALRPAISAYSIAKWGIRGLTLGMAKKLSEYDITVNAIAPGPTTTAMMVNVSEEVNLDRPTSPSKRYCDPEEIANLAVIMVSDLGKMINGDTLYVTGGCALLTFDDY